MRKTLSLMAFFVISVLLASLVSAASTPSTLGGLTHVDSEITVEVNDEEVDENTLLIVEEGEALDIEVELKNAGTVDAEGIEVVARLSGYEYSDYVELEDSTSLFDVKAGTKKKVSLELTVPRDLENEDNTLRVFVLDRNSAEIVKTFQFFVESPRHSVDIEDVYFSPGNTVKAGKTLLTTVVVENFGENDEDDVTVTVEVPALGVKATEVVEELEAGDSEDVPEMFLSIPANAQEGDYQVKVTVKYDKYETVTETFPLKVVANENFQAPSDKLVLESSPEMQTVAPGQTVAYGIGLINDGKTSKAYTLEVLSGDWATVSLSDNLVVLSPGQSKIVRVDVTAAANAVAGEHSFSVAVKSGEDVLETVMLKANVAGSAVSGSDFSLRNGLEVALIVLVVLLVIIGLIVGFSRLRKDEEDEEQTYY
ncbi:MAG TPA: hypothetical protein VJC39_03385 [Candidatus Nanoarchaeia archaeon]|nr:hypothetical protein [Candidatus Nanoarchaeia archaeon]